MILSRFNLSPILLLAFISLVKCFQFGFYANDDKGELNNRFVAFGTLPDNKYSKIKTEVIDQLNLFFQEEMRNRSSNGVEKFSFSIENPDNSSPLSDGRSLLFLKGELSNFSSLLRHSCNKISQTKSYWCHAKFFSDPIIILNFGELGKFSESFKLTLIKPEVSQGQDSIYDDCLSKKMSVNIAFDDTEPFLQSEDHIVDSTSCDCCNRCTIA